MSELEGAYKGYLREIAIGAAIAAALIALIITLSLVITEAHAGWRHRHFDYDEGPPPGYYSHGWGTWHGYPPGTDLHLDQFGGNCEWLYYNNPRAFDWVCDPRE